MGRSGARRPILGALSQDEALWMVELIRKNRLSTTLETGVANGLSTLAIASAVQELGGHHFGVDPCQISDHDEAAIVLMNEFGLIDSFTLLDGPAHLELPHLIQNQKRFDFIFIDGIHLFDFKLIDFFLADQLLQPGGFLLFHDLLIPSVKKTLRYIQRHRDYELLPTPTLRPSVIRKMRYLAAAFLKRRPYWYYWPNGFANLLVLRKRSEVYHRWDYFKNF